MKTKRMGSLVVAAVIGGLALTGCSASEDAIVSEKQNREDAFYNTVVEFSAQFLPNSGIADMSREEMVARAMDFCDFAIIDAGRGKSGAPNLMTVMLLDDMSKVAAKMLETSSIAVYCPAFQGPDALRDAHEAAMKGGNE